MILRTYIPRFPLDQFIQALIYFEGIQHAHTVDRLLPNGETEILIDFHDTPQYIYDNNTLKEIQACNHVWAAGVRTEPITIPAGSMASMMVVSFKKGMSYPFYPFPVSEVADHVLDSDLIWGDEFALVREQMLETDGIDRRFALMENFLLDKFASRLVVDECVSFAVSEMSRNPDRLNIARMNAKIGYSQKHFISMFKRRVGLTPKAYLKIMRFQKAIRTIESIPGSSIDWAAISYDCGFYDQSHFINDFRVFSGFTPEEYLTKKSDYLNYVPVG
jgi:AraC-like DNA-binding protein